MEASELRTLTHEELKTRIRGWRDELFRAKLRGHSQEMKNTSIFEKLKRDIARGCTLLTEKANILLTEKKKS